MTHRHDDRDHDHAQGASESVSRGYRGAIEVVTSGLFFERPLTVVTESHHHARAKS